MFDGLRLRAGLAYSRYHFRKQKDGATRFSEALNRSRRALVILPELPVDPRDLTDILLYLARRFPSDHTRFLVREDLRSVLPPSLASQVHTYSPEDVTGFFTPRTALLRSFQSSTFDVAFDLNREFSLTGAFLCRSSGAPLRVSFTKDHADRFYNLQVQTHGTAGRQVYKNLLTCLDMF